MLNFLGNLKMQFNAYNGTNKFSAEISLVLNIYILMAIMGKDYAFNQYLVNRVQFLSTEVFSCLIYIIVRFIKFCFLLLLCYFASPIKENGSMIQKGEMIPKSG